MPLRVEIRAALAKDLASRKRKMSEAEGFDLSPFNRLRGSNLRIPRGQNWRCEANPATLFDYDFESSETPPRTASAVVAASWQAGGRDRYSGCGSIWPRG